MQTQLDTHKNLGNGCQSSNWPYALRKHNLVLSAITMLSDKEISSMSREDLLDVLRMARSPWPRMNPGNIDDMDVPGLKRVLVIVREYFREQMNRRSISKDWKPEFN